MGSFSFPTEFLVIGIVAGLVQIAAALPWIAALDPVGLKALFRRMFTSLLGVQVVVGTVVALGGGLFLMKMYLTDVDQYKAFGRVYASVLQLQLMIDLFVFFFAALLAAWPHGGAVALAAFREGVRQPMFWVLTIAALILLGASPFLPYFTFGEDYKMMKEIGYDTIMLAATAFGVIAAGMSISEEIEGKTAITLMSKPISRRQFLLGKFFGISMAALAMTLLLGWCLLWLLLFKSRWDPRSTEDFMGIFPDPEWVRAFWTNLPFAPEANQFFRGLALWGDELSATGLGLVIGYCQLMVLLAIAVALATRLPMLVNLVVCLVIFFLGHLAPILSNVSQNRRGLGALVHFTAQLFHTLLPGLEYYDMGPAVVRDAPLPPGDFAVYVASVTGYSLLYTAIALLFGLILFEDRDLA
jgi:hypothetical protein